MSITVFLVLARILTERNLLQTRVGMVTIACAAIDDVIAWCLLASVALLVRTSAGGHPLWLLLLGTVGYVVLMLFVIRPLLKRFVHIYHQHGQVPQAAFSLVLLLVLASAWFTEWLGIHALFGAFVAGVIMPKDQALVHALREKLADVTVALFLPLFFAFTGLRTSIGLVSGVEGWFWCVVIIAVAIAGKLGGAAVAVRATGMS